MPTERTTLVEIPCVREIKFSNTSRSYQVLYFDELGYVRSVTLLGGSLPQAKKTLKRILQGEEKWQNIKSR